GGEIVLGLGDDNAAAPEIPEGYFRLPGEGANDEEIAAFRNAIGTPEKADDYFTDFEMPDHYQPPAWLAEFAHGKHLPKAVVQDMVNRDIEARDAQYAELEAAAKKEQKEAATALKKEWGEDAKKRMATAQRSLNAFAPEGFAETVKRFGLDQNADFIRFLDAISGAVGEASFADGSGGNTKSGQSDAQRKYPYVNP